MVKFLSFLKIFLFVILLIFFLASISLADHRTTPPKKGRSPCKIEYPSDVKIEWRCQTLKKGETLEKRFGARWKDVARFNRIDRRHAYSGASLKIPKRLEEIENFTPMPEAYSSARGEAKFILIDLSEQFLAAYEYGRRVLSSPIASGVKVNDSETPAGEFRMTTAHLAHQSSLYFIEETTTPYPMNYALQFYVNRNGISFWLHGRDLPGYPASHGCIGLYDEEMQKQTYGFPPHPQLDDARMLYKWVLGPVMDSGKVIPLKEGPRVRIIGQAP